MTTCRQVTRLISESADRRLAITEQDTIERHFEICPACRRLFGIL